MNAPRNFLDFPIMPPSEPFKRPAPPSYAPRVLGFSVTDATSVRRNPDNTFDGEEQVKRLQLEMQHDARITVCFSHADALRLASQLEPATFVAMISLTAAFDDRWVQTVKLGERMFVSPAQQDAILAIHEIVKRLSATVPVA